MQNNETGSKYFSVKPKYFFNNRFNPIYNTLLKPDHYIIIRDWLFEYPETDGIKKNYRLLSVKEARELPREERVWYCIQQTYAKFYGKKEQKVFDLFFIMGKQEIDKRYIDYNEQGIKYNPSKYFSTMCRDFLQVSERTGRYHLKQIMDYMGFWCYSMDLFDNPESEGETH